MVSYITKNAQKSHSNHKEIQPSWPPLPHQAQMPKKLSPTRPLNHSNYLGQHQSTSPLPSPIHQSSRWTCTSSSPPPNASTNPISDKQVRPWATQSKRPAFYSDQLWQDRKKWAGNRFRAVGKGVMLQGRGALRFISSEEQGEGRKRYKP